MTPNKQMHFDKPVGDIIRRRRSVRTYDPQGLPRELKEKLQAYAAGIKGPFGAAVRLQLIDNREAESKSGGKIGTYGVIKGASSYVAGVVEKKDKGMEQLGYCLEQLVLYAASLGLGTCWLGGTFKRSQFGELIRLGDNELLPIVTPVGYPADKKALMESLMRKLAGSDNRKPWEELFFNGSFDKPLSKNEAGIAAEALEMVRLAPSASNKQPWRILKQGAAYHFYLQHTKGYSSVLDFSIQKIDMGIAMSHFEMTLEEAGIKGQWSVQGKPAIEIRDGMEYIVSWVM